MPGAVAGPRTLYDKVFSDHIVDEKLDGTILLYIGKISRVNPSSYIPLTFATDRHLVHEVTSPVRSAPTNYIPKLLTVSSKLLRD